jgi:hypothetical protein
MAFGGIKVLCKMSGTRKIDDDRCGERTRRVTDFCVSFSDGGFIQQFFFAAAVVAMMHRFLLFDVDNLWATVVAEQNHIYIPKSAIWCFAGNEIRRRKKKTIS